MGVGRIDQGRPLGRRISSFPISPSPTRWLALRHPSEYPMNQGRIVSTAGLDIEVQQYEEHFEERQVEHSTALHAVRIPEGRPYFVGPLARINQNLDRLSPTARQLADRCRSYLAIL